MADTPMSGLPALPGVALPALPSLSTPGPSSSSVTPQPPPPSNKRPTPATPDTADGPPKRKRVRKSAAASVTGIPGDTTPGPGKNWRKGLKGNLAGVGLEGALAAAIVTKPTTPTASVRAAPSPGPPPVPLPPLVPFHPPPRTASYLIGPPPKLATQFLPPQVLEPGAPRPRRWARAKMEFRNITGGTVSLLAWQGDSFSSYGEHLGRSSIDELASPPPSSVPRYPHPAPPSSASSIVQTSSGPKPSLSRTPQPPLLPGVQAQPHAYTPYTPYAVQSPSTQPAPPQSTSSGYSNLAPPTIPPYQQQEQTSSPNPAHSPGNAMKLEASPLAPPTYPSFPTEKPASGPPPST
ncbi:uncharacterized protein JCM6883_001030 [Sporobolomyces salmoneus]|uniref:uncharacterized protein n=1 Tax=Sporobolomyces salmoneus TaxID=183962 RepID=UPI00317B1DCB